MAGDVPCCYIQSGTTAAQGTVVRLQQVSGRFLDFRDDVANYLTVLFNALEQRWPSHQVCKIKVQVIVFGVRVKVAEIEMEQVRRLDSSYCGHYV